MVRLWKLLSHFVLANRPFWPFNSQIGYTKYMSFVVNRYTYIGILLKKGPIQKPNSLELLFRPPDKKMFSFPTSFPILCLADPLWAHNQVLLCQGIKYWLWLVAFRYWLLLEPFWQQISTWAKLNFFFHLTAVAQKSMYVPPRFWLGKRNLLQNLNRFRPRPI